jgi:cytoskeletal protein RodZ
MLENVSIGGTLAGARRRAGLSVADVSAHTRIRQPIIRAIEHDDFDVCGGDFYARGHIRAIARTVGLDSEPLVREYDAARLPEQAVTQPQPALRPGPARHRRRRAGAPWALLAVLLAGLAVISFGSYRLVSSSGGQRLASAASGRPSIQPQSARASQPPSQPASHGSGASSGAPAAPSPSHAPAPPPVRQVTPVSAMAFGPGGTSDGDNPRDAPAALSGDSSAPWTTDWYTTAQFGNLKSGTGLLVDLGRTVTASAVTVHLGSTSGANLQVRTGTSQGSLSTTATASGASGTVTLHLSSPRPVRYVVIWFTSLPPDASGTYQASISDVTVTAQG